MITPAKVYYRLRKSPAPYARPTLGKMINQSTVLLLAIICLLIISFAVLNLFHKNASATKGYALRRLERDRQELQRREEIMKTRIAESRSLVTLQSDRQIASMLEVKNPVYIKGDSVFAENQRDDN